MLVMLPVGAALCGQFIYSLLLMPLQSVQQQLL